MLGVVKVNKTTTVYIRPVMACSSWYIYGWIGDKNNTNGYG